MEEKLIKSIKFCLFAALFTPLIYGFSYFLFPFVSPKMIYFCLLVEISVILYLLLIWRNRAWLPSFQNWVSIAVAGFISVAVLSSFFGVDFHNSWWSNFERMEGLFVLLHCFAYFILLTVFLRGQKTWRRYFEFYLGVAGLVIFFGFLQYILPSGHPLFTISGVDRVFGTLGNAIYLGQFSLFTFWIAGLLAVEYWKESKYWVYLIFMAVGLLGIYLSGSRGPFLGLVVGLVVYAFLRVLTSHDLKPKFKYGLILGPICLIIFLGVAIFLPNNFTIKIPIINKLSEISTIRGTANTRLMAWNIAGQGFLARPILGWGWFNYYVVFDHYFNPNFTRIGAAETWFDHAHNQYFDLLSTTGAAGLLSYLLIYIAAFYYLYRLFRAGNIKIRNVVLVLLSLLISHAINNIFVFEHPSSYFSFFIPLSFIIFCSKDPNSILAIQKEKTGSSLKFLLAFLLLIVVVAFYAGNYKAYDVNNKIRDYYIDFSNDAATGIAKMKQYASLTGPFQNEVQINFGRVISNMQRVESGSPNAAIYRNIVSEGAKMMEDAVKFRPLDTRSWLILAQLYKDLLFVGEDHTARMEEILRTASELSPNRQLVYYYWSELRLLKGDYDGSKQFAQKAIDLDPQAKDSYWFMAKIEGTQGNWSAALENINKAINLGFSPDESQSSLIEMVKQNVKLK